MFHHIRVSPAWMERSLPRTKRSGDTSARVQASSPNGPLGTLWYNWNHTTTDFDTQFVRIHPTWHECPARQRPSPRYRPRNGQPVNATLTAGSGSRPDRGTVAPDPPRQSGPEAIGYEKRPRPDSLDPLAHGEQISRSSPARGGQSAVPTSGSGPPPPPPSARTV